MMFTLLCAFVDGECCPSLPFLLLILLWLSDFIQISSSCKMHEGKYDNSDIIDHMNSHVILSTSMNMKHAKTSSSCMVWIIALILTEFTHIFSISTGYGVSLEFFFLMNRYLEWFMFV